jgi:hypothetical protein
MVAHIVNLVVNAGKLCVNASACVVYQLFREHSTLYSEHSSLFREHSFSFREHSSYFKEQLSFVYDRSKDPVAMLVYKLVLRPPLSTLSVRSSFILVTR